MAVSKGKIVLVRHSHAEYHFGGETVLPAIVTKVADQNNITCTVFPNTDLPADTPVFAMPAVRGAGPDPGPGEFVEIV